jgi:hypothetical protein
MVEAEQVGGCILSAMGKAEDGKMLYIRRVDSREFRAQFTTTTSSTNIPIPAPSYFFPQ